MSAPWHNLPNRAGGDRIATIRFAGSICTVTRQIPKPWRSWAGTMAPVLLLFALMSAFETRQWPWLALIALFLIFLTVVAAFFAVRPDRTIIFDAEAKTVRIFSRYPWLPMERTEEIPFSAVYSIGFKDNSADGQPPGYDAFLRLKGWREITL